MQGLTLIIKALLLSLFWAISLFFFYASFFELTSKEKIINTVSNNSLLIVFSLPLNMMYQALAIKIMPPTKGSAILIPAIGFLAAFIFFIMQFLFYKNKAKKGEEHFSPIFRFTLFNAVVITLLALISLPMKLTFQSLASNVSINKLLLIILVFYIFLLFVSEMVVKTKQKTAVY